METPDVEWTFEQKAECFKKEIHARFTEENDAWKKENDLQKEAVLKKHPDYFDRPGHEHLKDNTDSFFWTIYQECVVEVTKLWGARIILPTGFAIYVDFVEMFEHTEVAWSTVSIQPGTVDGEARIVLSIMLIDYWDDERSRKWHEEKRVKEEILARKIRSIVI